VLGVSLATARTWIAPFGTFALGLPIVPLAIGTLDGSGNGGFTIPIPAEPALVGVAVHAQAFVQGTPELITNLASIMFRAP
jgi:hypothetical protein